MADSPSLEPARELLAKGDARAAFTALRAAAPERPLDPEMVGLFADLLLRLGGGEEVGMAARLLDHFDDLDVVLELGFRLLDAGIEELAIPFFDRALALAPAEPLATLGLAHAWAALLAPSRGIAPMQAQLGLPGFEPEVEWWIRYHSSRLLANDPDEGLARFCAQLRRQLAAGASGDPDYAEELGLQVEQLFGMHRRWVGVADRAQAHVRPWHFIQFGSAILLACGHELGGAPTGGRYGMLHLSPTVLAGLARQLGDLLAALGRTATRVVPAPGRDAAIVAGLIARVLDVPLEASRSPAPLPPGALLVAADARELADAPASDGSRALRRRGEEAGVFALRMDWRSRAEVCPDVVGLLAQRASFPWEADSRPAEPIAAELAEADPSAGADWRAALAFYRDHAGLSVLGAPPGAVRSRFVKDSPVFGSYFF